MRSIVNVFIVGPSQADKEDQSREDTTPSETSKDTAKPAAEEAKAEEETPVVAGIGAETAAAPATAPHYDQKQEEAAPGMLSRRHYLPSYDLADRRQESEVKEETKPSDVADSATVKDKLDEEVASRSSGASAKRPYENTPLVDDNLKPHKMPKVDDSEKPLDKDVNGALQDGKASELDLPGTFPGSAPESVATPEAVQDTEAKEVGKEPFENKSEDTSSARQNYEPTVSAETTATSATEVSPAPSVVPGLSSDEAEKQPDVQPSTETAGETSEKQNAPAETVAGDIPQARVDTETKPDTVAENATAAKTEEVPSSTTLIPSVVVSEAPNQAQDSAKASEGAVAVDATPAAGAGTAEPANKETAELNQESQDLKVEEEVKSDGKKDEQKAEAPAAAAELKASDKQEQRKSSAEKVRENAAKEAEKKTKEIEKERKKGGLWNWLKRKIKGEKSEKSEKQPEGAGGSQVTAPANAQ